MIANTRRAFVIESLSVAGCVALTPGMPGVPGVLGACLGGTGRDDAAFLKAVIDGDANAVQGMLAKDETLIAARDGAGRSAFALALLHGHGAIGDMMRQRGHEPDIHEAALALDWDLFNTIAAGKPEVVNAMHPIGGTAMHAAALGGAGSQMWRVYNQLGVPNPPREEATTPSPVRMTLDYPDVDIAEMAAAAMLGNGADPTQPEPNGDTALHAAAARGMVNIVEMLIRKGLSIHAKDATGRTPYEAADRAGHVAVMEMMRREKEIPRDHDSSRRAYDVNGDPRREPDWDGLPMRRRADVVGSSHGNFNGVRGELKKDARLAHAIALTTEAAVEAGAHMGNHAMVDLLLEHGAAYSLPTAVMKGDTKRVKAMLAEESLRIHERGAHNFALLWYPCIGGGHLELMELLLDAGADVEWQHHLGITALHKAAQGGQLEMAALLIERGANVNRVGRQFGGARTTPLQVAEGRGHGKIAALLRQRGAKG